MNTITLETLRADFEASLTWNENGHTFEVSQTINDFECYYLNEIVPIRKAMSVVTRKAYDTMNFRASLHNIALRYGLRAAMTYKLSDGVIDPRKKEGE